MKVSRVLAFVPLAMAFDLLQVDALSPHGVRALTPKRDIADIEGIEDSDSLPVEKAYAVSDLNPAVSMSSSEVYSSKKDHGATADSVSSGSTYGGYGDDDSNDDDKSGKGNNAFLMAISMIIVSEIGDKTFLISALMAMRHSRVVVFSASFTSLAVMTVLSGLVGRTLPTLLSPRVTQFLASVLFVVFGIKLTQEGLAMSRDLGVDEELAEVEEELTVSDMNLEMNDMEAGRSSPARPQTSQYGEIVTTLKAGLEFVKSLSSSVLSPLWVQVFIMIFLGEWGDRSQIATIAMAAGSSYWAVIMGAVIGHGLCTLAAVIGGKILASRISMRTVTLGGAFAFFVFAILYFFEAMSGSEEA